MTSSAVQLDHVASDYRRYPGEPLTFYTRVMAPSEVASALTLRVTLPDGVTLERTDAPPTIENGPRVVSWPEGGQTVTWLNVRATDEAQIFALYVTVEHEAVEATDTLISRAFLEPSDNEDDRLTETVTVAVSAKSRYLRHLPALYERDELMGRFLMLFESFWDPIEGQIDQLPYIFDPRTAPPDLLPWLASWLDLVLDPRWPEPKRRRLLRSAVHLYRRRGTRDGLADYLEIYTGVRPQIVEHRAENFVLGPEARLGQGIALGQRNAPHTFTVKLDLPALPEAEAGERRRMIEQIIEAEKSAHAAYLLDLS